MTVEEKLKTIATDVGHGIQSAEQSLVSGVKSLLAHLSPAELQAVQGEALELFSTLKSIAAQAEGLAAKVGSLLANPEVQKDLTAIGVTATTVAEVTAGTAKVGEVAGAVGGVAAIVGGA